jgi:hypothetical protein
MRSRSIGLTTVSPPAEKESRQQQDRTGGRRPTPRAVQGDDFLQLMVAALCARPLAAWLTDLFSSAESPARITMLVGIWSAIWLNLIFKNTHAALDVDDATRADWLVRGIVGKRLTYRDSSVPAAAAE